MKIFVSALPLLFVLVLMAELSYAQPLPPVALEGAPIDGFALLLIASGAAYGGYHTRKKK